MNTPESPSEFPRADSADETGDSVTEATRQEHISHETSVRRSTGAWSEC